MKIAFVGKDKIGKSALIDVIFDKDFNSDHLPRNDVRESCWGDRKILYINLKNDDSFCPPYIYLHNTEICCLCFSAHDRESFDLLQQKIDSIKNNAPERCRFVLVATKADLTKSLSVSQEEIDAFVQQNKISGYVSTSTRQPWTLRHFSRLITGTDECNDPFLMRVSHFISDHLAQYGGITNDLRLNYLQKRGSLNFFKQVESPADFGWRALDIITAPLVFSAAAVLFASQAILSLLAYPVVAALTGSLTAPLEISLNSTLSFIELALAATISPFINAVDLAGGTIKTYLPSSEPADSSGLAPS